MSSTLVLLPSGVVDHQFQVPARCRVGEPAVVLPPPALDLRPGAANVLDAGARLVEVLLELLDRHLEIEVEPAALVAERLQLESSECLKVVRVH